MEFNLGFLDLNQQNLNFLHDVLHGPFSLIAFIVALLGLFYSFRSFFATRKLSRVVFVISIAIIVLLAILVD